MASMKGRIIVLLNFIRIVFIFGHDCGVNSIRMHGRLNLKAEHNAWIYVCEAAHPMNHELACKMWTALAIFHIPYVLQVKWAITNIHIVCIICCAIVDFFSPISFDTVVSLFGCEYLITYKTIHLNDVQCFSLSFNTSGHSQHAFQSEFFCIIHMCH